MTVDLKARVLVVDEDWDTLDLLARILREQGHQVALATDGQSGLKRAVEIAAEVVLVDRNVTILDIRTFLDVLTDNPRTADAHVFVLGRGDRSELGALHARAEPIVKPFHAEEVAARVLDVIRARREPARAAELEGDLQQVALFDLLQVFAQNRRTGLLRVESGGIEAEIWIRSGAIVDASCGAVTGEKALFRALGQREGKFIFMPDRPATRRRIDRATDHLLMEAVRHSDERTRLLDELPSLDTQVHLTVAPSTIRDVPRHLAEAIASRLEQPRSLQEVLDLVADSDVAILEVLVGLWGQNALRAHEAIARTRFCDEEEIPAMRTAALRLRRPGVDGPVRLGVAGSFDALTRFARALSGIEEFLVAAARPSAVGNGMLGALGRLRLGGTDVEVFALPTDDNLRPWLGAFLAPAQTLLLLDGHVDADELRLVEPADGFDRPKTAADALRLALAPAIGSTRSSGTFPAVDPNG